jgi:hypothetical protein
MKFINFLLLLLLVSCSYSVNLAHTDGQASDLIEEDQKPSADLQVPALSK